MIIHSSDHGVCIAQNMHIYIYIYVLYIYVLYILLKLTYHTKIFELNNLNIYSYSNKVTSTKLQRWQNKTSWYIIKTAEKNEKSRKSYLGISLWSKILEIITKSNNWDIFNMSWKTLIWINHKTLWWSYLYLLLLVFQRVFPKIYFPPQLQLLVQRPSYVRL